MSLSCKFAQRGFRVHNGTTNFANAMTIFMAEHFSAQKSTQNDWSAPTSHHFNYTNFANARTIFLWRAFITQNFPKMAR